MAQPHGASASPNSEELTAALAAGEGAQTVLYGDLQRLWAAIDGASPASRPECVDTWIRHFSARERLRWIQLERGGKIVLALPVVGGKVRYPAPAACLPGNAWGIFGDLFVDPAGASADDWDRFFAVLADTNRWLLRMEAIPMLARRWNQLEQEACQRGWIATWRRLFDCPIVEIRGRWADYVRLRGPSRLRNHMRNLRKLDAAGSWRFRRHSPTDPGAAESLLRRSFEVEHRGWKGAAGSSILSVPSARNFYVDLGRQLAPHGMLEIYFLELGSQPIAAGFAFVAKGSHFLVKVGYDESFARYGPGQLLVMQLLRELFDEGKEGWLDFYGRAEAWSAGWATSLVPVGRLDLVPPRIGPRALWRAITAATSIHWAWPRTCPQPRATVLA